MCINLGLVLCVAALLLLLLGSYAKLSLLFYEPDELELEGRKSRAPEPL